jgi:uncharacterized protein RhaS with RHS repeats
MKRSMRIMRTAVTLLTFLAVTKAALAFYDPAFQRWINRDPIEERGGQNLYNLLANTPINRVDSFGLAADHCKDPCGDAKKQRLDKGQDGGVICCAGKKYVCVWKPGKATNAKAIPIVTQCITDHEKDHLDDIDCPKTWCYGFPTRPPFKKGKNDVTEECSAYKLELSCLQSSRSKCGGDPQCEKDVDAEIKYVADKRNKLNCQP